MAEGGIGASVRRKEDARYLVGGGRYTDDIVLPHQTYACMLRSPHAHARLAAVRTDAALAMPGVLAVFTGADIAAAGLGGLPCGWQVTDRHGNPMAEPPHPLIAKDIVRHVGDIVAMVVAESLSDARDAAEAIEVDYQPLQSVTSALEALDDDAPAVHEGVEGNLCYDWEIGDAKATEEGFAKADRTVEIEIVNNRVVPSALEPRAANAHYDAPSGAYTLYMTSQNPHVIRLLMCAFVLHIPEQKVRVVAPDVGGGFGSKIYHYAEEALVTWAAAKVMRPVKWTSDRAEAFVSDAHGRDHVSRAALALDAEGRFLALKVDTVANMGAYLSTFAPSIPTYFYALMFSGQYATPAIHVHVRAAFTHTTPVDAYRGAGRSECLYLLERIVEAAARATGIDSAEIRRRNFIAAFPYSAPLGVVYDSGDFNANLDEALKLIDRDGFEERRRRSEAAGRLRGFGLSCWIESSGAAPSAAVTALGCRAGLYEAATVRVHPTGGVTVFTGAHAHGQGHETTFAQVVADKFGLTIDQVDVIHGDTAAIPFGMGTFGSRSMAVGGGALSLTADKVVEKAKRIAAHLLEASVEDIVFEDGTFKVAGTDKEVAWASMALASYIPANYPLGEMEPGLEETTFFDPSNFTFPNGVFACEVEVDRETGASHVDRLISVHDAGRVINPMIVDGQIHGGAAQAVGQALLEGAAFERESGQLLTGSFMDYCLPRADDLPAFDVRHNEVPCAHNPLGVKGAGEAGATGAPAAVMNAVTDALASAGAAPVQMPARSETIWRALEAAGG